LIYRGPRGAAVPEADLEWYVFPFRGEFVEHKAVGVLQQALFAGQVDALEALVVGHEFASEALRADAEQRSTRLIQLATGGGIDYIGEGPYPAHWRMDANRGVFHYAGRSPWCWEAYRLLLDLAVVDPPPAAWTARFPLPDAGAIDAGGTPWDFFGDISNESYEMDTHMAKLFDSFPVWLSPPESSITGFLDEKDVVKLKGAIEALGEGRRERSFYLRAFHSYLGHAEREQTGLTAFAIPLGTSWTEEAPHRLEENW
jgi:hypothetical protein